MRYLVILVLFYAVATSTDANAESLSYTRVTAYMDWEPDCSKPYVTGTFVTDIDGYNFAVDQFNSYMYGIKSYLSCVADEAERDMRIVMEAIQNRAEELRSEAISEFESTKADLEYQRDMLRY